MLGIEDFCNFFDRLSLCKSIPSDWKEASAMGEWKRGVSAGGCQNSSTWIKNPQYQLHVSQQSQAFIVLSQGSYQNVYILIL